MTTAATYTAPSLTVNQHTGQYGDFSYAFGNLDGSQPDIGVTAEVSTVKLLTLQGGSEVYGYNFTFGTNGTSSSMKLGFQYKNPAAAAAHPSYGVAAKGFPTPAIDYFKGATDTSSAGSASAMLAVPVRFELPVEITITASGVTGAQIPTAQPLAVGLFFKAKGNN